MTVLVVKEGRQGVRQFRLGHAVLRVAIVVTILVMVLLVVLISQLVVRVQIPVRQAMLERENAALRSQLVALRGEVTDLRGTVSDLFRKDEQFRLLAGLEPLDEDVRSAGIGGPDDDRVEAGTLWQIDNAVATAAFQTHMEVGALVRRARLLSASFTEAHDTLSSKHAVLAATPSITPTTGFISSAFSRLRWHPILDRPRAHQGLDFAAQHGAPILAAAKGRVSSVGYNGKYGLTIELDHGFGYMTRYAHASAALVHRGQLVSRGDTIAKVGNTGLSVGPHLHYEVLVNGRPVNPRKFLLDLGVVPD